MEIVVSYVCKTCSETLMNDKMAASKLLYGNQDACIAAHMVVHYVYQY